jgi:hypothetical protein
MQTNSCITDGKLYVNKVEDENNFNRTYGTS